MSVSKVFWKAYFRQSLGVGWWVGPQKPTQFKGPGEALPHISQDHIFVTPSLEKHEDLRKMLERMIIAIRQDPETLFCLSSDDPHYISESLKTLEPHQKVLFFGPQGPRPSQALGAWFTFKKAKAMVTFELKDLQMNPRLKKQAWVHLQDFSGLRS